MTTHVRPGSARDSGSIVLGWLTRLTAVVALFGLLAFDGIALVKTNFSTADHASTAARAAADAYRATRDPQAAYAAAQEAVPTGEVVDAKTFSIRPADGVVTLELKAEAVTLWMHYLGPLKRYTAVTQSATGAPAQ